MKKNCNLVKDLLPLYVEDMVSADTREFVREHLAHCAACQAEFERARKTTKLAPDTDIGSAALKRVKRGLLKKRLQTIFFTAVVACAIAAIAFGILTAPKFFPYSDHLLRVFEVPDGSLMIGFDRQVTGYSCNETFDSETETKMYRISAWTTTWDEYASNRGKQNMVIPAEPGTKMQIFYVQNNGSEDILIYGFGEHAEENGVTLPRLIFMPYFLFAFLALVVLAVLRLFFRKKQAITVWIDRAILFPIAYMAAQLCTKGLNFTTYASQRDFCVMLLVAILLYFAMLTGKTLYQTKRNASRKQP